MAFIEQFLSSLQTAYERQRKESLLSPLQAKAFERFTRLGLPTAKWEAFQYASFHRLYEHKGMEESPVRVLWREAFPSQIVALSLAEALKSSYAPFLQKRLEQLIEEESDPFALLSCAMANEGLFLYVPPKVRLTLPLDCQILHRGALLGSRIHVFVGKGASVQFHLSSLGGGIGWDLFDLHVEEGGEVTLVDFTGENPLQIGFRAFRASLKRSASLSVQMMTEGGSLHRYDYKVSLMGEGAKVELSGLSLLRNANQAHVHVHVDHGAWGCLSRQLFKQVVLETARSSFMGKISVRPLAQKTEAYQLSRSLVLSKDARVYSKPNLEIFADDVKASHGATVSQLQEEEFFYLRTRGVDPAAARLLLTEGFCREVLDQVAHVPLRQGLQHRVRTLLGVR